MQAGEIRVIKEVGSDQASLVVATPPRAFLSLGSLFFSRPSGPVGFFRFEKMATSFIDSSFNTKAEYDAWLAKDHIRTAQERGHERADASKMHEGGKFSGIPTDFTPGK